MMKSESTKSVMPEEEEEEVDDERLAARFFQEGKQVLVELSTDPAIVQVDDSEVEAEPRHTGMMRSLSFKVGFSRFKSAAAPAEMDIKPIDEEAEVEETEEERLMRERVAEENRKLEKIKKDIRKKEIELLRVYEIGKTRRREYLHAENAHKRDKNAAARHLWRIRKSHNMMSGVKEYKHHMFKVSLPCHDTSNSILASEAKLLKTWHTSHMLEHQMTIMHEKQDPLINFLHKGVMEEAQKDKKEAISAMKEKVFAYLKGKEELTEAYEDVMTAQRTLIGHLQLHDETEDDAVSISDSAREDAAKLAAAAATGNFRDFKSTKLRRSAELRIEAKFGSLKERQAKKEIREEVFNRTLQNVEEMERTSLERAKNVSGEIESVLSSIQVNLEKEELTEHPDEDEEEMPVPVAPADTSENDVDEEKDESSAIAETMHASFVGEEEVEDTERHEEDDHLESSHNDSASQLSTSDDHSQSSRRRKVDKKEKADISARLEKLRAKRQQQQQQARKLGVGSKQPTSSRRAELLERARSARSTRLVDPNSNNASILSPRTKEAKLAELRERRRNRAAAAIPPATVAEGS